MHIIYSLKRLFNDWFFIWSLWNNYKQENTEMIDDQCKQLTTWLMLLENTSNVVVTYLCLATIAQQKFTIQ